MRKHRLSVILIIALCITLLFSWVTLAQNESDSEYQNFKITADNNQIKILQDLYLKDISYGELVEKVYPEALEQIPETVLEKMFEVKVEWKNDTSQSMPMKSPSFEEERFDGIPIVVKSESRMTPGSGYIYFSSDSSVVFPLLPFPYMSVISMLIQDDVGPVVSAIDSSNLTTIAWAFDHYNSPVKGKLYYTIGEHFGQSPPGFFPPTWISYTSTPIIIY